MLGTASLKCCDGMGARCRKEASRSINRSKCREGEYCEKERGQRQERSQKRKEGIGVKVREFTRKLLVGEFQRYHTKQPLSKVKCKEMGT